MVSLSSPVCQFDSQAMDFSLPGVDNKQWSLKDCKAEKGLLVMFICNHCPYVQAIIEKLVFDCTLLIDAGVGCVAIASNDVITYPDDSFENMQKIAQHHSFPFPYLYDETQQVAKQYGAVCTPDFFGYNADLKLQYRGRFDDSGRNHKEQTEHELLLAMLNIAKTGKGPEKQYPSIGCSIKWRQQ